MVNVTIYSIHGSYGYEIDPSYGSLLQPGATPRWSPMRVNVQAALCDRPRPSVAGRPRSGYQIWGFRVSFFPTNPLSIWGLWILSLNRKPMNQFWWDAWILLHPALLAWLNLDIWGLLMMLPYVASAEKSMLLIGLYGWGSIWGVNSPEEVSPAGCLRCWVASIQPRRTWPVIQSPNLLSHNLTI